MLCIDVKNKNNMSERQKIKGILVDFDGTLFDTWSQPYTHGQRKGLNWEEVWGNIPNCPLYEGWKDVFECVKTNDIPIGIVSHCTKGTIERTLKYWKLTHVFDSVLTRYGEGQKGRFKKTISKDILITQSLEKDSFQHLNASDVVYLSDQERDVESAHNAGVKAGACYWGTHERELLNQSEKDFSFYSPKDIIEYLDLNK